MLPDGACSPGFSCTTLHPPGLLADLPAFCAWATATKLTHATARIPIVRFMIDVLVCGRKRRQPRGPRDAGPRGRVDQFTSVAIALHAGVGAAMLAMLARNLVGAIKTLQLARAAVAGG